MSISLGAGCVTLDGDPLLTGVADAVQPEADALGHGLFLSARAVSTASRRWFELGAMPGLARFTACHRYEPYWMKPCAGTRLSQVPSETQVLLAHLRSGRWLLIVPLIGDLFRFSLRGGPNETLSLLGETGDAFAPGLGGLAAYVAAGSDPFDLVKEGALSVVARLGTGRLRKDKPLPDFVDRFGWCTWDAFYQGVSADKVREGLEHFAAGGVRPRVLILDDGWQSTERMPTGEDRLTSFAANGKFGGDLGPTVRLAKEQHGIEIFLVWHSIVGYWGGVDGTRLPGYAVKDQTRQFGEGILSHAPSFNHDWWGNVVGFVSCDRIGAFFDDYHRSLAAQGVDGVKVDSQAVIESVACGQGGRLPVARAYREALEASVVKHFEGRLINCMSNGQETWYGSRFSTVLRSSIDFFPARPESHGAHLYANAQVALWFGEFMHPDWDMFQSGHEWGAYHAAGRAISGGPVYVSDKPGEHNFELLRRLVCRDGTVLRCDEPARPTLDTICVDPTRDDVLLKVWSRSGPAAVIGVFNARGLPEGDAPPRTIAGDFGPADVPDFPQNTFACYAHNAKTLELLVQPDRRPIALGPRGFELFTLVPVHHGFAAIGLADKLNAAAAVVHTTWSDARTCDLTLRDGGEFVAWSQVQPAAVDVDGRSTSFAYDAPAGRLTVLLHGQGRQSLRLRW